MHGQVCGQCELYSAIDEKRLKWYNELSKKNISLLEKVYQQEESITNLQKRLIDRNNIINLKDIEISANYFEHLLIKVEGNDDGVDVEIKKALEKFEYKSKRYSDEKNQFKKILIDKELEFSKNVTLYKEMAEYYRETLFKEMKDCQQIKRNLTEQAKHIEIKQNIEEKSSKTTDLLGKYKLLLNQHQSDLKNKEIIIDKLRKDRKMLYLKISQIKKDVQSRTDELTFEIQKLKSTVARWREKYSKLENMNQMRQNK